MSTDIKCSKEVMQRIRGISNLIGNTPLLEIEFLYKGQHKRIYAKAEYLNFSGSIKDRMAFHIMKEAYANDLIQPGYRVIEATSGNTGIAFSAVGRALGHPVTIFMPDWMSEERKNLIRSYGAEIVLISKEEGGFLGSIRRSQEMAATIPNSFLPLQFDNEENVVAHFNTTGPEIWWQLQLYNKTPDAFVAGVGTGGTIMGVGRYLKTKNPNIKLYPLEPSNSPTMSTGYKVGIHRIQGISDEFIPSIVKLEKLNEIIAVDDGDSIIMAQKLASELGLAVGISSGANFLGALMKLEEIGDGANVVTIFSDDNKKYLSTGLLKTEPVKAGFISTDVQLLSFKAIKRSCIMCCDPEDCDIIADSNIAAQLLHPNCKIRVSQCINCNP